MRAWGAINVFAPLTDSGNILRQSNGASHRSLSLLLLTRPYFLILHVHLLFNLLFLVGNVQTKRKEKGDLYTHPGNTISIIPEHDSPWLCLSRACTSAFSLVTNYYNSKCLTFFFPFFRRRQPSLHQAMLPHRMNQRLGGQMCVYNKERFFATIWLVWLVIELKSGRVH